MSLLETIEKTNRNKLLLALKHQERYYSQDIKIFDKVDSVHTSVYGSASGDKPDDYMEIKGVLVGDDFFPSDSQRSGSFQEGFLYTSHEELIQPGTLISVKRSDGKFLDYRVIEQSSIGFSIEVFKKYKLSAVGEDD